MERFDVAVLFPKFLAHEPIRIQASGLTAVAEFRSKPLNVPTSLVNITQV